jgi:hypothetical protein
MSRSTSRVGSDRCILGPNLYGTAYSPSRMLSVYRRPRTVTPGSPSLGQSLPLSTCSCPLSRVATDPVKCPRIGYQRLNEFATRAARLPN